MSRVCLPLVVAAFLTVPLQARAAEVSPGPVPQAVPAPSSNQLVADLGLEVKSEKHGLLAMGFFAGFQRGPVRLGALIDGGVTWYDWTTFYGVGVGPVLELPFQFRASLIASVGWQRYHVDRCNAACVAARVTESGIATAGRLGIGRSFRIGRRVKRIVVMGWLTANYARSRTAALTQQDILYSNQPDATGGFRPGGMLTVGLDFPL